ncbi:hypothetical protein FOA52_000598 [Chlamydomonas sp. UWO 241]|nr:hypothetical protein FOA52_000598 [Chlamydomonas sp. UWO 241]
MMDFTGQSQMLRNHPDRASIVLPASSKPSSPRPEVNKLTMSGVSIIIIINHACAGV